MKQIFVFCGFIISFVFPIKIYYVLKGIYKYFYTGYFRRFFASFGQGSIINPSFLMIVGPENIYIGKNTYIGSKVQLTAWRCVNGDNFFPQIRIGDDSSIGDESQITAINKIIIGNGVLTGKKILITDNSHGQFNIDDIHKQPLARKMYSKGPVTIKDNVWIGEKSSVLAGVTIGKGAIIAANSVVTKDVPDYCLVAGCPAIIIKRINENR